MNIIGWIESKWNGHKNRRKGASKKNRSHHVYLIQVPFFSVSFSVVMRQFGPNAKFGPETDSDQKQIRPKILITFN